MDRNDLVSVVVPFYNVENYLGACIESIQKQTYENLEIILIDDGSADGSARLAEQYAESDGRIRVISQANAGVSAARNRGVREARGKYLCFVDSDDLIRKDFAEQVLGAMVREGADLGICGFERVPETYRLEESNETGQQAEYEVFTNKELLFAAYQASRPGLGFMGAGKIYKTSLFRDHDIVFPAGQIHEDIYTSYRLFYYSDRAVFVKDPLYYYRQHEGSIMHTEFSAKNLAALGGTRNACDFFIDRGETRIAGLAVNYHLRLAFQYLHKTKSQKMKKEQKDLIKEIRRDCGYLKQVPMEKAKKAAFRLAAAVPADFLVKAVMLR